MRSVSGECWKLVFLVLEGFSGTGKTTLAKGLEAKGWLRLQESAHAVPSEVPVADRADTQADFSLLGATMTYTSIVSRMRPNRDIVAEGYLLSDLAYARIRYDLNKSTAFPSMLELCREIFKEPSIVPDLYIILVANEETIDSRQARKDERERNLTEFFRTRYYSALSEIHDSLGQKNIEKVFSDGDSKVTLDQILGVLGRRELVRA
jgi:deoxyadenosine/deoxycytidine kinase